MLCNVVSPAALRGMIARLNQSQSIDNARRKGTWLASLIEEYLVSSETEHIMIIGIGYTKQWKGKEILTVRKDAMLT